MPLNVLMAKWSDRLGWPRSSLPTVVVSTEQPKGCADCHGPLDADDIQKTARGWVCPDCYFKSLGEELDKHPIGVRRGAKRGC